MTPRPIRSLLLFLLFASLVPASGSAYPISPVPLWSLIEGADLVVLARVTGVELNPRSPAEAAEDKDDFDRDVAVLDVLETWKGGRAARLQVTFGAGYLCPAPPRFLEGRIVLVFLERAEKPLRRYEESLRRAGENRSGSESPEDSEESAEDASARRAEQADFLRRWKAWAVGRWVTVGLSYGTLYPDAAEVPVFRSLIADALRLQKGGPVSDSGRREWLVRAASRRATRWHGLYELAPLTDRLHSFYDFSGRTGRETELSTREFAALEEGFVREPSTDRTLPMMLSLLAGHGGREVDRAAASSIEAVIRQQPLPWWIGDAMARVLERFADPDPQRRLGLDDPHCDGAMTCSRIDLAALPGIWRDARRELGIPEVAPAQAPARVPGVGSDTPS